MKTKPRLNKKFLSLLLVSIFALTAIFGVLNKFNFKKDNSSAKILALEQSLLEAETEISNKNAVIQSQADTISSQSSTISTQSTRINTLESELSSEYNYQYSIDVDFYVDSTLYMSGKARNGGTILIAPTEPTKSGYTFTGWSLTENGTVVDLTNTTISQATSFYAIFEVDAPVTQLYVHNINFLDSTFGANFSLDMQIINSDSSDYTGYDYSSFNWSDVIDENTQFTFLSNAVTQGFDFEAKRVIERVSETAINSIESFTYDSQILEDYGNLSLILECNNGETYRFDSININSDTVSAY